MLSLPRIKVPKPVHLNFKSFIRFSCILHSLKDGSTVSAHEIDKFFTANNPTSEHLSLVHEIVKDHKVAPNTINQLLKYSLPEDFSLYHTLKRANPSHVWDNEALKALIMSNPGRVDSSWTLLERYGEAADENVHLAVIEKLLEGENSEIKEDMIEITHERLDRAIDLLNRVNKDVSHLRHWDSLLAKCIQLGCLDKLDKVEAHLFVEYINEQLSNTEEQNYLALANIVLEKNHKSLTKANIAKMLSLAAKKPDTVDDLRELVDFVELEGLDCDKNDPEALLVRLQLIPAYGIALGDFNKVLEKFHKYSTHEKFGIELVQAKVVQVFSYQAFKRGDKTLLNIAETLVNPEEIQVKTLAQLILARAKFDSEKSLKLYNDYIQQVSKDVNEVTKRSPTGILTEALMVASLYDNDREFAQLLYEKAIQNKMLIDEAEIALIKKVFKKYGESFQENDTWKQARPRFTEVVLEMIKRE
ncbi:hypothetical protein CJJ07_001250 [Candidozyma auris]|nr:hypothetical protein CJJ07_001250 [[Candida] auris]QEL58848.1 hypothetical protein CJJ09_000900 [[Candida] auris]